MALSGKLITYVEISKEGHIFHDLFRHNPHKIASITPDKIHDCELHEGERGAVGSVVTWQYYTHDGKKNTLKQILEAVDEEKQLAVYKAVGGDLMERYKSFTSMFHVEQKGDAQVAALTFEFEKVDVTMPYPTSLMDYLADLVKDLDAHSTT